MVFMLQKHVVLGGDSEGREAVFEQRNDVGSVAPEMLDGGIQFRLGRVLKIYRERDHEQRFQKQQANHDFVFKITSTERHAC